MHASGSPAACQNVCRKFADWSMVLAASPLLTLDVAAVGRTCFSVCACTGTLAPITATSSVPHVPKKDHAVLFVIVRISARCVDSDGPIEPTSHATHANTQTDNRWIHAAVTRRQRHNTLDPARHQRG